MDGFLDVLGLYRSDVAKDSTCLFRAVSEQLFYTQIYHHDIRQSVIKYIKRHKHDFENFCEDLDERLEKLEKLRVWAGPLEMHALSLQYRLGFSIYMEVNKPPVEVTSGESKNIVVLAGFGGNRFDCVYSKSYLLASAVCQSITYEVLYQKVFGFGDDVKVAVDKMLHDKSYSKQRRNLFQALKQSVNGDEVSDGTTSKGKDPSEEIKRALEQGIPPFPYKVAKALDPCIYRNVEFDIWNEEKKETLKQEHYYTPDVEPGVKCKVHLEEDAKSPLTGHIQEVMKEKVLVYIEELCRRVTVSVEEIEVIPIPQYKALTWQGGKTYRLYREPSKPDGDKKNKKKLFKKGRCESLENEVPPENDGESKDCSLNLRFRTSTGDKRRFTHNQVPNTSGFFKKAYGRKSGPYNAFSDSGHNSMEYSDPSENDVQSSIPVIPAPMYTNEQDSGFPITYDTTELNSDMSFSTTTEYTYADISYSLPNGVPIFSSENQTFLASDSMNVDFPAPGMTASTPLRIPRTTNYYQEDPSIFPITPSAPAMTIVPMPSYFVYQKTSQMQASMCPPGSDINAGIYMNTPPNTGATPPQLTWFPNYGGMVQQNYGIPSSVPGTYFPCTPPMSANDIAAYPTQMYTPQWNASQQNFTFSASVPYPFQPVVVPVPDQSTM